MAQKGRRYRVIGVAADSRSWSLEQDPEPFVYQPAHRRESVLKDRLRDFVREVFDGQAGSVVLSLVDDESLSADDLKAIEQRIADAESGKKKKR